MVTGRRARLLGLKPRRYALFTASRGLYLTGICFTAVILTLFRYFGEGHVREMESGLFVRLAPSTASAKDEIHSRSYRPDEPVKISELRVALSPTFRPSPGFIGQMPQLIFLFEKKSMTFEELGNLLEKLKETERDNKYSIHTILALDEDALHSLSFQDLVTISDLIKKTYSYDIYLVTSSSRQAL